jgi:hypothetical protein
MGARNPQTQAKRAREFAVKEKRERKRAKKAENAALRAAGIDPYAVEPEDSTVASNGDEASSGEAASALSSEGALSSARAASSEPEKTDA